MEVRGSSRKFLKVVEVYCSLLTLVEVMEVGGLLRKSTKFHKTCASRWKSIGVYGSSRKVPPNIAMEAQKLHVPSTTDFFVHFFRDARSGRIPSICF